MGGGGGGGGGGAGLLELRWLCSFNIYACQKRNAGARKMCSLQEYQILKDWSHSVLKHSDASLK